MNAQAITAGFLVALAALYLTMALLPPRLRGRLTIKLGRIARAEDRPAWQRWLATQAARPFALKGPSCEGCSKAGHEAARPRSGH